MPMFLTLSRRVLAALSCIASSTVELKDRDVEGRTERCSTTCGFAHRMGVGLASISILACVRRRLWVGFDMFSDIGDR
jgi:hypothetical protein